MATPKFLAKDLAETKKKLQPIVRGAMVTVVDVLDTRKGFRYLVEEVTTGAQNYYPEEDLMPVVEE